MTIDRGTGTLGLELYLSLKIRLISVHPRSQGPLLPVPWSDRGDKKEGTLGTRLISVILGQKWSSEDGSSEFSSI